MVRVVLWTLRLWYIPGWFLNCLKINILSGLLMVLDRRQFYGNAWKYRYMEGVEKNYLPGSLRFGGVVTSWVSMDASNIFCLRFYFLVEI